MKSFANDPSLDRVLLISREEMGGAAGGFDPLHPVYTQTEGADPFTYRNDFCHMRLLADGTVELTEFGRLPALRRSGGGCFPSWPPAAPSPICASMITMGMSRPWRPPLPPMAACCSTAMPGNMPRLPGGRVLPVFSGIPMASAPSARMKCSARWGPFRHWMASGRSRKQSVRRCRGIAVRWPICCKKRHRHPLRPQK